VMYQCIYDTNSSQIIEIHVIETIVAHHGSVVIWHMCRYRRVGG
jgi:hypothetical protein